MKTESMNFFEHKDAFIGGAVVTAIHNLITDPMLAFVDTGFVNWFLNTGLKCIEVALYGLIGGFVGMLGKKLFTDVSKRLEEYYKRKKK